MADEEPAAAGGPVLGGKIIRHSPFDIDQGWNSYRVVSGADHHQFLAFIYDRVLGYDDNGRAEAELAESWETPDDLTYLFNFAPGRAVFQDGVPVDANAMQLNMEFLTTDEEASANARANSGIANAASFEAVDDVTWRMVNSVPNGPTLAAFWTPGLSGGLMSPNAFDTNTDPVGAGPARWVEHVPGESWLGEGWDGYWDSRAPLRRPVGDPGHQRWQRQLGRLPRRAAQLWRPPRWHDPGSDGGVGGRRVPGGPGDRPGLAGTVLQHEPDA